MKKLRECPFCKEEAKTEIVMLPGDRKVKLRAYCPKCTNVSQFVVVSEGCMFGLLEDVINEVCDKWNGRNACEDRR